MKFINYYDVLGISQWATHEELRAAYVTLAHKHSPFAVAGGVNKAMEEQNKKLTSAEREYIIRTVGEKLDLIREAYNALRDPVKRTLLNQQIAVKQAKHITIPNKVNSHRISPYAYIDFENQTENKIKIWA